MASTRDWFESVAEARRRARRRLPRSVFLAIEAGAEAGVTRAGNVTAFREIRFAPPRAAGLPAERDLRTSVLGVDIALPVIASPVGVQAVHPLGEVAVAAGTRDAGTAMGLSEFASKPVADVARVNPDVFFQVHWSADRETLLDRALRPPEGRREGPDRHPRLVVPRRPRLGQPARYRSGWTRRRCSGTPRRW